MSHERDVLSPRPVFLGLGALVVLLILGWAIPTWLEVRLVEKRAEGLPPANPLSAAYGRTLPPAPRLQVNPDRDIETLRAAEHEQLTSYGWVDRRAGVAHIPITRAMELLADDRSPIATVPDPEPAPDPAPDPAPPSGLPSNSENAQ